MCEREREGEREWVKWFAGIEVKTEKKSKQLLMDCIDPKIIYHYAYTSVTLEMFIKSEFQRHFRCPQLLEIGNVSHVLM